MQSSHGGRSINLFVLVALKIYFFHIHKDQSIVHFRAELGNNLITSN